MSQYWKGSYDFTSASDDNELDSSDDSDSDGAIEAPKLYHRRKSTAATVRARVSLRFLSAFLQIEDCFLILLASIKKAQIVICFYEREVLQCRCLFDWKRRTTL